MKFYLIICLFLLQNVIYCQNNTSNNNFDENFLKILINEKVSYNYQNNKYDYADENRDNILQKSEVEKVTQLDLLGLNQNIKSLKGIENFINLTHLYLTDFDILSIDLTRLLKLRVFSISNTKINELNFEGLKALSNIIIGKGNHSLNKINFKNSGNISQISINQDNIKLKKLNLKGLRKLRNIDFLKNIKIKNLETDSLRTLGCHYSFLEKIDPNIKNNIVELTLYSGGNTVVIKDYVNLTSFFAKNEFISNFINISNLYFENLPKLTFIDCSKIFLNNIYFKDVKNLSSLFCSENQLNSLPNEKLIKLEWIDCSSNKIDCINFNNYPNLKVVNCKKNLIQNIEFNQLKRLEIINCNSNNLKSIYLENLEELKSFDCRFNDNLEKIILKNIYLEKFYPSYSTKHICVDNFFLNNIKYLASLPDCLVDSNCDENNNSTLNPDITTIEKALNEFNDAIKNEDTKKLKYICTRKGFEELTSIKNETFGETLLNNYRNCLYHIINNQNMCGIETKYDKNIFFYYFSKQLDEWKYYGILKYE